MTPFTPEVAERLWYMAAGSELGLTFPVRKGDAKVVEKEMYLTRIALADPELDVVVLKVSEDAETITLYKKTNAELPE